MGCSIGVVIARMAGVGARPWRWWGDLAHRFLRVWPPVLLLMLVALAGWPGGYVALALALGLMIAPRVASACLQARPETAQGCPQQAGLHLIAEIIRGFGGALALVALLGFMRLTPPDDAANWGAAIAQGREHLGYAPAMMWIPALALWLSLIACQQIAETIRAQ
jgi:ABC-type dipeptide/oligopeptide/nickel transport system permease subunit